MASALVQAGSTLYSVDLTTGVATALSLPSGVTLSTTRKPRFAVLNQWVVMTNSPSRNLVIDPEGVVRPLVPMPPTHGPVMVAGSGTGLTGAYLYKTTFRITNSDGDLLIESPLSPPSSSVTLANKDASLSKIEVSADTVSERGIYRTLTGGTTYYLINTLNGNTATTLLENTADTTVSLLPASSAILVTPPGTLPGFHMKDIVQWKSRLWGISDDPSQIDTVFISETNKVYAWPNSVVAYPTGQDSLGVVRLLPRKNQLGILKRNGLWQIAGSSSSTGISVTNVSVGQVVYDKAGCVAPDSAIVINDKAYWLGKDGVYEWGDEGVQNISNGFVAPWFHSDTYFNRNRFPNAFAKYNELRNSYELHLSVAGGSTENRWISYNLTNKKWYGPHLTAAFTPTHAGWGQDSNGLPIALTGGSDGVLYTGNSSTYVDGASTAIAMDIIGPWHSLDDPDIVHQWGSLSMLSKIQAAGSLTITPYIGRLDAAAGTTISHDLTTGRERLRNLGVGPLLRLRFAQSTASQGATIYGYETTSFEVGKR